MFGVIGTVLASSGVARANTDDQLQVPDYFVGLGGRGLKGDPFATVIGAKIKLTDFSESELTFSARPELLLGGFDSPGMAPALTVEDG
jgi:hypothetical protein